MVFDDPIRHKFRSILNILIHFSLSLSELMSVLAILGLQIVLTITQTCAFHFGIGFWSFPFLLISPLSIWLVIWRRNLMACFIAILIHFCSTLFATAIIIVSFLVLIGQIGFICSTSSLTSSYIILNSALIGIAGVFKLLSYSEVILLYQLIRNNDQTSPIFIEEYDEKDYPSESEPVHVNIWRSWSAVVSETRSNSDIFFA
jgi:hypothetical protein